MYIYIYIHTHKHTRSMHSYMYTHTHTHINRANCAWDDQHNFNSFYDAFVLLLFITTGENWVSTMQVCAVDRLDAACALVLSYVWSECEECKCAMFTCPMFMDCVALLYMHTRVQKRTLGLHYARTLGLHYTCLVI